MKKSIRMSGIGLFMAILLTGCLPGTPRDGALIKTEGLENFGEIMVISREEGSGTRDVFADITGLKARNDKGIVEDQTSANAQIAIDATGVIEKVSLDEKAIGYVSLGALKDVPDDIKVVAINQVKPEMATIKDGSYMLSRGFNLAYSGTLNSTCQDFLNYIFSAGQKIVGEGYTTVKMPDTFLSDKSKGSISISGSSSIAPLMMELADDYKKYNSNVEISVLTTDSTAGLTSAMQKNSDFGMSSRELKDFESELLKSEVIAKDGIAVIVNSKNPVETLTLGQLKHIFSGEAKNWSDINK